MSIERHGDRYTPAHRGKRGHKMFHPHPHGRVTKFDGLLLREHRLLKRERELCDVDQYLDSIDTADL